MADTVNRVETLTKTGIRENERRFELTFAAANGSKHTVSLPLRVAADLLPVFAPFRPGRETCRRSGLH